MDGVPALILVLGGARSGKSRYAEALVERQPGDCIYLATGEARDDEMAERIQHHRSRRGPRWCTVEAPLDIVAVLRETARPDGMVLVDCLTLWLSNLMAARRDVVRETTALVDMLTSRRGPIVFVANEVGLGIVPENALARAFRDHAGRLNQALASIASSVVLMVAGLPLIVKPDASEALES